jgi:hypothetical protein
MITMLLNNTSIINSINVTCIIHVTCDIYGIYAIHVTILNC